MNDFLQPPPQGAIPTQNENIPFKRFQWKSFKTPEAYAGYAIKIENNRFVFDEAFFEKNSEKYGFSYWDKESEQVKRPTKFRFFVMDTICRVDGKDEITGNRYWSNSIFDSRTDVFSVFMQGIDEPVYLGIYKDFEKQLKTDIKGGVGFHTFFAAWSPELGFIEVPTSAFAGEGARMAIADTQNRKKHTDINLFDLTKKGLVWGFVYDASTAENCLIPIDRQCNPYAMKGELYFAPRYSGCGNMPSEHPMYNEFIQNQTMFREYLNAKIKRSNDYYNNYKDQETPPQTAAPATPPPAHPAAPPPPANEWGSMFGGGQQPQAAQTNAPGGNWGDMFPTTSHANTQAAQNYQKAQSPADANVFTPTDDLPF